MNLGFLDFLAYYVPGIIVVIFLVALDTVCIKIDFVRIKEGILTSSLPHFFPKFWQSRKSLYFCSRRDGRAVDCGGLENR